MRAIEAVALGASFAVGAGTALFVHYCVWLRRYSPSREVFNQYPREWDGSYSTFWRHHIGVMADHGTLGPVLQASRMMGSFTDDGDEE